MELENLKYIWRTMEHVPAKDQNTEEQNSAQILALLGKKSRSPITKMRKNLVGELVLMLTTYIPAMGWYLFGYGGRLSEMAWLLLLLMGLFAGYYFRKNKLLKEMQCLNCQVRSNLERQVKMLRKYIRFYTVAGTLLIPVVAICTFLLIRRQLPQPGGAFFFSWLIVLAPITTGIYYINTWYVNKMYGRQISRLQQLLEEMGEELSGEL
jgi:cytochrome bd-type quinol oxidase subunit 1